MSFSEIIYEMYQNYLEYFQNNENILQFIAIILLIIYIGLSNVSSTPLFFKNTLWKITCFIIVFFISTKTPSIALALSFVLLLSIMYSEIKYHLKMKKENFTVASQEIDKKKNPILSNKNNKESSLSNEIENNISEEEMKDTDNKVTKSKIDKHNIDDTDTNLTSEKYINENLKEEEEVNEEEDCELSTNKKKCLQSKILKTMENAQNNILNIEPLDENAMSYGSFN